MYVSRPLVRICCRSMIQRTNTNTTKVRTIILILRNHLFELELVQDTFDLIIPCTIPRSNYKFDPKEAYVESY